MIANGPSPTPSFSASTDPALLRRRKRADAIFRGLCFAAAATGVLILIIFLSKIVIDGLPRLSWSFLTSELSGRPNRTGIWPAVVGSLWIMGLTAALAVPVGVAAAVYLEEFNTRKTRLTEFIQLNISNLSGVPSIVYGLLGLAVFSRFMNLQDSVIAGALTMGLLVLPMVIIVTQEALRAVPNSYREGSLALGSTRWQAIRFQVLPAALPGIMTGVILAMSRAVGETAPLIAIGAASQVSAPRGLRDEFTVLPIQVFDWSLNSKQAFHQTAASAILVLMAFLLLLNSVAIWLRARATK
jgi:phosphate transport system permease protein